MDSYNIPEDKSNPEIGLDEEFPILATHVGFAEEFAADALGKNWVHPDDRDFVDRQPPHIPAPVDPQEDREFDEFVTVLRAEREAA